ncbi:MAG TPA: cytochrome C oxidase subunit IV family protein [Solimonas sp.]|nr:cytochrome C oxidase subunit IV family protein [Solimonas sp.]
MGTTEQRLAGVCAALTGVTLLSWWLGASHGQQAFSLNAGISFGVILIAAIKVRVIVWEFMELKHAPLVMRRIADAYLATIIVVLLALYLTVP